MTAPHPIPEKREPLLSGLVAASSALVAFAFFAALGIILIWLLFGLGQWLWSH